MSALPPMRRAFILGLALAALAAIGAHAAERSASAGVHPKAAATTHHAQTRARARRGHRAAKSHTPAHSPAAAAHHSSRHGSRSAAAVAPRRHPAPRRSARSTVALRRGHSIRLSRAAYVRTLHARSQDRTASVMDSAAASSALLAGPANTDHSEQMQTSAPDAAAETEEASLRTPRGAMPPPLRGSLESLERQNQRLDAEGLERIQDESDLEDRIAHNLLVPVPVSDALTVNPELPETHRYCRPWTAHFLADLAQAHFAAFRKPLEVSSAVRTILYQKRLMRINGNAAPAEGDIASPHLTGATIDIAKKGLNRREVAWMRSRLQALETAGKIDVEEEFRQACFHITVYKSYGPSSADKPATQARNKDSGTQPQETPDPSGAVATREQ
ncbi:MAG: DUF5715 family protein [Terracidiphilus sp.]